LAVKIVIDSTAYLDRQTRQNLEITEVSLGVNFEHSSYKEVEISNERFYELMAQSPRIPTSSQPSPADFYQEFLRIVENGDQAVGVFLSTDLSGTYYSAVTAGNIIL